VTRKGLFAHLEALFEDSDADSHTIVILIGMGGAGKTQLVLEYCRHKKNSGKYRAIFWIDASSRNAIYRSMETVVKQLLPERIVNDCHAAVKLVKETLSSWSDGWLLVFDNLDNLSDLTDIYAFFPDSPGGCILATSRHAGAKDLGQAIEFDSMEKDEGLQLLLHSQVEDSKDCTAAEQILTQLGYLPLAIDQVQAYILKRKLSLQVFLDEYKTRKKDIMQETPKFWLYRRATGDTEKDTSLSLLTTWEMSLQLLATEGGPARKLEDVLTLFAFFHPVSIREKLFSEGADNHALTTSPMSIFSPHGTWDHIEFEGAVAQMQELSLLQFSHTEIVIQYHCIPWCQSGFAFGVMKIHNPLL
jgi:hypothetical protein